MQARDTTEYSQLQDAGVRQREAWQELIKTQSDVGATCGGANPERMRWLLTWWQKAEFGQGEKRRKGILC